MGTSSDYSALHDLRPNNVARKLKGSPICLLTSHHIIGALKGDPCIVMACNIRIKHVIPGIMRAAKDAEAVVGFELAKSEGGLDGGYTGFVPDTFFQTIIDYADRAEFHSPFFIHGDHITVKNTNEKEIETSRKLIAAEMEAGYTSFCVDASFNPLPDNVRIATELARPIVQAGLGLESEVGEIKHVGQEGEITTVEEAREFIAALVDAGIRPDLLAINNGSKHGNYLDGEKIFIDLERTGEVYQAIRPFGVSIAQHGITGTPPHILGRFADFGIRKGNVGTQWQNVAHEGLPSSLMERMRRWAKENNKDIKEATKPFKEEIDSIPDEFSRRIEELAYEEATNYIKAFRAVGTARVVLRRLVQ